MSEHCTGKNIVHIPPCTMVIFLVHLCTISPTQKLFEFLSHSLIHKHGCNSKAVLGRLFTLKAERLRKLYFYMRLLCVQRKRWALVFSLKSHIILCFLPCQQHITQCLQCTPRSSSLNSRTWRQWAQASIPSATVRYLSHTGFWKCLSWLWGWTSREATWYTGTDKKDALGCLFFSLLGVQLKKKVSLFSVLTRAQYVSGGSPQVMLGGSRVTFRYWVISAASGWQAM